MKKTAWVIYGSSSEIAKSLTEILKEKSENFFLVGRDQQIDLAGLENLEINVVMFNGKVSFKKFTEISKDEVQEMVESNFTSGLLFLQKLFLANLQIKKVFTVGSRAGQLVGHHKYFSLYAATKTAMLGLFRSLSAEFPGTFFTYYICPSTDTEIFSRGVVDKDLLVEVKSKENIVKKSTKEIAENIFHFLENQKQNQPDLVLS